MMAALDSQLDSRQQSQPRVRSLRFAQTARSGEAASAIPHMSTSTNRRPLAGPSAAGSVQYPQPKRRTNTPRHMRSLYGGCNLSGMMAYRADAFEVNLIKQG